MPTNAGDNLLSLYLAHSNPATPISGFKQFVNINYLAVMDVKLLFNLIVACKENKEKYGSCIFQCKVVGSAEDHMEQINYTDTDGKI